VRLKFRLRGNDLYILYEGEQCPSRTDALNRVLEALQQTDLNSLLPIDHLPVNRVLLYSRQTENSPINWKEVIQLQTTSLPGGGNLTSGATLVLSNRSLAKQGNPVAIAYYLGEVLNKLGVAVRVGATPIPYSPSVLVISSDIPVADPVVTMQRLFVTCEAPYELDPEQIGQTITATLRELEIQGFRDAVIRFQVTGETQPNWFLKVDLTPPQEMLKEWGRWGDLDAIQRMLDQGLTNLQLKVSRISLQGSTLHMFCQATEEGASVPDPKQVRTEVSLLLETLGPQGIHAVTIYGQAAANENPVWVDWLHLPAAFTPALAEPPLVLAQRGDWGAIAFLLHRLLNPDLGEYLNTGGIRLQLLPKQDLLHIMTEAIACPVQSQVTPVITQFLQQLELPHLFGVRIYGRRAGLKQPLWRYGSDYAPRLRLVSEAIPEFAASAIYVDQLLPDLTLDPLAGRTFGAEPASAIDQIGLPTVTPTPVTPRGSLVAGLQSLLTRSQLFIPLAEPQTQFPALPGQVSYRGRKGALLWGAMGVLLLLQVNLLLGQMLRAKLAQSVPTGSPSTLTAADSRSPSPNDATQPVPVAPTKPSAAAVLPAETPAPSVALPYTLPNQADSLVAATIAAEVTVLPTFNSPQLDEKLKLYYHYLEEHGRPPDVLVLGSSRALRGVDPLALEQALAEAGYANVKVFNFGINGATAQVVDLLTRQLLTPDQLPRLIIWADGARAFNSGAVDVTYNGMVASEAYRQLQQGTLPIPNRTAATSEQAAPSESNVSVTLTDSYRTLDRWFSQRLADGFPIYRDRDRLKNWLQQMLVGWLPLRSDPLEAIVATSQSPDDPVNRLQTGQPIMDRDGFLSLPLQFNPATYYQKYARVSGSYDSDYENFQIAGSQDQALRSLLAFTQTQQIPIVFVNLPLTDQYLDPVRLQYEQDFRQYMTQVSLAEPNFVFRDLSDLWVKDYDYFSDPSHLNRYGAYATSARLAQDPMIPWIQGQKNGN
jgi:hypothetical protein